MQIDLPYLMQDMDRHGNVRLYVRRKGIGKVRLRLVPGSPKFMDKTRLPSTGSRSARRLQTSPNIWGRWAGCLSSITSRLSSR